MSAQAAVVCAFVRRGNLRSGSDWNERLESKELSAGGAQISPEYPGQAKGECYMACEAGNKRDRKVGSRLEYNGLKERV
jgi:hypothetical protein